MSKPRAFTGSAKRRARLLIDVRTQFALHDRIQERKNFAFGAADLKFDPAVR